MDNLAIVPIKKHKTKKAKLELIIVEECPKILNSSSSIKSIRRCNKGTNKQRLLGPGCYTNKEIADVKWFSINDLPKIHFYQISLINQATTMLKTMCVDGNI